MAVGLQHDHTLGNGIWLDTPGRLAGGDVPAATLVDAPSGDGLVIGPGMHVVGLIPERAFGLWYAAGSTFRGVWVGSCSNGMACRLDVYYQLCSFWALALLQWVEEVMLRVW